MIRHECPTCNVVVQVNAKRRATCKVCGQTLSTQAGDPGRRARERLIAKQPSRFWNAVTTILGLIVFDD